MVGLLIVLGVVAVIVLSVIGIYNALIGLRNQVKNSWSQIDVQLKRRYDLIPNLVETAKGYVKHEQSTLENITKARSQAMSAQSVPEKAKAEGSLTDAVNKFFLVVESYPDLKANQNFLVIQEELRATENRIAFARQNYNDTVLFYNNKIEMFPSNLIASAFTFRKEPFFQLEDKTHAATPQVKF